MVARIAAWVALAALGLAVIVLVAGKVIVQGVSSELLTRAIFAPLVLAAGLVGLWVKLSGSIWKWNWERSSIASAFTAVALLSAFAALTSPEENVKYYGVSKIVLDDGVDYNLIMIKAIGENSCMQRSREFLEGATRRFHEEGCTACKGFVIDCVPWPKLSAEMKEMVDLRPIEVSYWNKDYLWVAHYWKSQRLGAEACEASATQFKGVCVKRNLAADKM